MAIDQRPNEDKLRSCPPEYVAEGQAPQHNWTAIVIPSATAITIAAFCARCRAFCQNPREDLTVSAREVEQLPVNKRPAIYVPQP